ncbi:hypothetical protein GCM10023321_81200 [Pseudonocardia eucalypti]|uniref:Uncharacterized protein n=1 Tax=Pseudonocardia eucalypti TaxID=648755 RepID=A0ABP9RDN9_9PSEU
MGHAALAGPDEDAGAFRRGGHVLVELRVVGQLGPAVVGLLETSLYGVGVLVRRGRRPYLIGVDVFGVLGVGSGGRLTRTVLVAAQRWLGVVRHGLAVLVRVGPVGGARRAVARRVVQRFLRYRGGRIGLASQAARLGRP